jgi:hypothetical protein
VCVCVLSVRYKQRLKKLLSIEHVPLCVLSVRYEQRLKKQLIIKHITVFVCFVNEV